MKKIIALEPLTLGSAGVAGATVPAMPPEDSVGPVLATAEISGMRFVLRSGQRTAGVRPRFPSASVVLSVEEAKGWRDLAFAEEPLEGNVEHASIAVESGKLRATYAVRSPATAPVWRAVELPLPPPATAPTGWKPLPAYPLAPGMGGIIAGTHHEVVIVAGGANFRERMPWDGGQKTYDDEIFILGSGDAAWRSAGRLPERRAYAAVVAVPGGVLVLGGENAETVFDDTRLLRWDGHTVVVERGPPLSAPTTSPAAALLDGHVYLAGGYAPGSVRVSRKSFWRLDLARRDAGWESLPAWPGPARGMAVMAALGGAIYLFSGLEVIVGVDGKAQSTYLRDAFRYRPAEGWERLPDLPWSAVAAPTPAPCTTQPARIFVLGGVDGRQVGKLPRDTRVPEDIAYFDVAGHAWRLWPERWPDSVVTIPTVRVGDEWVFVSGEIMAGMRTTSAWSWRILETR